MTGQQDAMHRALDQKVPAPHNRTQDAARIGFVLGAFVFAAGLLVGLVANWASQGPTGPVQGAGVLISDTMAEDSAFNALATRIEDEEGFSATPYRDAGGFAIGFGFNLNTGGFSLNKVDRWLKEGIKIDEARAEVRSILRNRINALTRRWPPFSAQSIGVRYALADAAYELGISGLLSFQDTLMDIAMHDADAAAADIRDSLWYAQAPERAERLIEVIRRDA